MLNQKNIHLFFSIKFFSLSVMAKKSFYLLFIDVTGLFLKLYSPPASRIPTALLKNNTNFAF